MNISNVLRDCIQLEITDVNFSLKETLVNYFKSLEYFFQLLQHMQINFSSKPLFPNIPNHNN